MVLQNRMKNCKTKSNVTQYDKKPHNFQEMYLVFVLKVPQKNMFFHGQVNVEYSALEPAYSVAPDILLVVFTLLFFKTPRW